MAFRHKRRSLSLLLNDPKARHSEVQFVVDLALRIQIAISGCVPVTLVAGEIPKVEVRVR